MTELIRAVPCACVRLWKRKGEGKRIENENERNRERERIGISGREGVANVQATTGGAFQSQHDETKAEAIGEDWLMRDVRAENDDNYATRDTNCPRAVSLSTEERMYPLVPLSPCLFTLFLSHSLRSVSLPVLQGENNRETRVHRRWPVIHEHAWRNKTSSPRCDLSNSFAMTYGFQMLLRSIKFVLAAAWSLLDKSEFLNVARNSFSRGKTWRLTVSVNNIMYVYHDQGRI